LRQFKEQEMANLTNSTTSVLKATHVPLKLSNPPSAGWATVKSSFVRNLALQSGEVDAVQQAFGAVRSAAPNAITADANFWSLLRQFEGTPLVSQLPLPSAFANIQVSDLTAFGNELVNLRQQKVQSLQSASAAPDPASSPQNLASTQNQLNTGIAATKNLVSDTSTSPIGMLNLERLEMTPAGIERGGLLATIPLAPKERTAVVQEEWSVISQEFTSIVTDSLENYSQTGVTENTQLAQATGSQISHGNQFNISASASGGCGFVSASVATQFGTQDQTSQSATESRNQAVQTTRQASSRVKQSHKMTISTQTTSGTSESTTRMLENPSATDPMRIDYFSLMRKWYVALYRYGLRLTYDITIPEPAAAMREVYKQLAQLQSQAGGPFVFDLKMEDITPTNYVKLADKYSAQVPTPPDPQKVFTAGGVVPGLSTSLAQSGGWTFWPIPPFTIPDGYWITDVSVSAHVGIVEGYSANNFGIEGTSYFFTGATAVNGKYMYDVDLTTPAYGNYMQHYTGSQSLTFWLEYADIANILVTVKAELTPEGLQQWASSVWNACYNAAQTAYYATQQQLNAQIQALQAQINGVDTLTLRREENDEIMKCVLRWLLPNFEFMPQNVINLFKAAGADPTYGVGFTGNDAGPSSLPWNLMYQNEDRINFINQAIDWNDVVYFLYSYFWDVPASWDFIRQIQHPDSTRQAFLRAGSARIVLTVNPGWELAWTYFVEYGSTSMPDPLPAHPYLTIAQQIADYDNTNYPGIPPANPNGGGPIDDDTPQTGTTCDVPLAASNSPVVIAVADSTGFVPGATAIVDTWQSGVQETQSITAVPDGTHITVQALGNAHSPTGGQPFPVVQASAAGLLIGEWFEYTPTSGTDIAVTSNLATIA
jgi:hypothetical protein